MRVAAALLLSVSCFVALQSLSASPAPARVAIRIQDCAAAPWLTPCAPIEISADGIQTLQLIAAKADLISSLEGIAEARQFVALLEQAERVVILPKGVPGRTGANLALSGLSQFVDAADRIRPQLQNVGWMAIRRDLDLHLATLATENRERTPEGRFFAMLGRIFPERGSPAVQGEWRGTATGNGRALPMYLVVRRSGGAWSGEIRVADQSDEFRDVVVDGRNLSFTIGQTSLPFRFTGTMSADGMSLSGSFTSREVSGTWTLTRQQR